ncbi:winged helix-turn-helix transcriptional regulator [Homoserinibacter gongjuensis]|uniref:HxlR family transcriptional regulator n=1 Tax=Homoserinibacter gongjuensis TaxID=1162968 RepID=A0ABQ6JRX5_9MICO|nr:HxlR family transcriptional regulator [Homoserinibacter gongjuensis]
MAARDYGQYGGVARAVELVGERWALLIVRDLLVGPRRYGELAAGLPRIPSNILATRLKELQAAGIIRRAPRSRIVIYELTPYGRELEPIVLGLAAWGLGALEHPRDEQVITPDSMTIDLRSAFRANVALELPPTAYAARLDADELLIRVDGPRLEVNRGAGPADLSFAAGPGIHRLIAGELDAPRAIATGAVEVLGAATTCSSASRAPSASPPEVPGPSAARRPTPTLCGCAPRVPCASRAAHVP